MVSSNVTYIGVDDFCPTYKSAPLTIYYVCMFDVSPTYYISAGDFCPTYYVCVVPTLVTYYIYVVSVVSHFLLFSLFMSVPLTM